MLKTRILPYEEWDRLRIPIKQLFGLDKEPPTPDAAPLCAVEEDEQGRIIGFLFLQTCAHLEPFGSLGGASLSRLKMAIDSALPHKITYYMHADTLVGVEKAKELGFEPKGIMLQGVSEI